MFVANHTSAFMDPIVIAITVDRVLHFLARGESFKSPFVSTVLSWLNMIPIYRPEITPEKVIQNEEIFQKCYDHLASGKCIIIFPEGFSKTERRLRKIKTGTARIALGAEAQHDFNLGLTIMPIGINYSNPHFFQSDLFLNIGTPIVVSSYLDAYKLDDFGAARKLTDDIKAELEKRTVVIQHVELDKLIENIEKVYRGHLRETVGDGGGRDSQNFFLSKEIVNAVSYFYTQDKRRVLQFNDKISSYLHKMKALKLRDTQLRDTAKKDGFIRRLLFIVLTFPAFLYGWINNYLPYKLSEFLSGRLKYREDFKGSMQVALGVLSFLIFYVLQIAIIILIFNVGIGILYFLLLYPSGLFALEYLKEFYQLRKRLKLIWLFINRRELVTRLTIERQGLINQLENGKDEYLKGMETSASSEEK
jgi:1-acyl-sn-glycerol-3-phosphate acyltransferase